MTIELKEDTARQDIIIVHLRGKISKEDYQRLAPLVEEKLQAHDKARMLVEMHEFHGWTAGALWEDVKFDLRHFNDIERLALVGETRWQEGMATFCKPFTTAKIRFFPLDQIHEARQWIEED